MSDGDSGHLLIHPLLTLYFPCVFSRSSPIVTNSMSANLKGRYVAISSLTSSSVFYLLLFVEGIMLNLYQIEVRNRPCRNTATSVSFEILMSATNRNRSLRNERTKIFQAWGSPQKNNNKQTIFVDKLS